MRFKWEDLEKESKYVPGIHCTTLYCPHLAYCPAVLATVEQSTKSDKQELGCGVFTDSPTNNADAGFTMASISAARRQMKYVEANIKKWVKDGHGKVISGQYEWSDGNTGWRWKKS
jgi:hypothetical protein